MRTIALRSENQLTLLNACTCYWKELNTKIFFFPFPGWKKNPTAWKSAVLLGLDVPILHHEKKLKKIRINSSSINH